MKSLKNVSFMRTIITKSVTDDLCLVCLAIAISILDNDMHTDKTLNLDNLLIQIRDQVTPKWYQFGLAVGINKETLDEFSNFTPEECIIEILDLWLRTNETTVTWRDVADALKEIGCH